MKTYKITSSINDIPFGGMEIYRHANNIEDFVKSLRLKEEWWPYGYQLKIILVQDDSMTAYLFN